jgi:hypothetical protein
VATERQIAANRRNAKKSTGPRSGAAKKRTSRNAYRHGLSSSSILNPAIAKRIDTLTRLVAGNSRDRFVLDHARTVVYAELDLARVRDAKVALIKSISARGALHASHNTGSLIEAIDVLATMPTREPERTAEAARRALPELRKLDRYESRALARRDRAIGEISKRGIKK